jgi:hypothetical protein
MSLTITPDTNTPTPFDDDPDIVEDNRRSVNIAFNTIESLIAAGALMPEVTDEDSRKAHEIMATGKALNVSRASAGTVIKLEAMLTEYDHEFLNATKRFENYITNKILLETGDEDPKVRLKALELLGKRRGVNLFSDQLEVTIKSKPSEEIEERLNRVLGQYLDKQADIEDVEELDLLSIDLDKEFGLNADTPRTDPSEPEAT